MTAKALVFDMYGTLVDVGAVAEACKTVAPDPVGFNQQWRAKQLEYTFLRSLMGTYAPFWQVTEQALDFTLARSGLKVSAAKKKRLMDAWLHPTAYPEVAAALPRLAEHYALAVLSNGNPKMLRVGLSKTGLAPHIEHVLSVGAVRRYKPSPEVYQLAVTHLKVRPRQVLFVSSNGFDVMGAKRFGFRVCWINRTDTPLDPLGIAPDLVVKDFDGLVAAVGKEPG